jgi:hypothetical protein
LLNTSTYPKARAVLKSYARYVIQQSRSNLSKGGRHGSHKASGNLYKSLKYYISKKFNRNIKGRFTGGTEMPSLTFEMNKYGKYLDLGVKGKRSNYIKNRNAPHQFGRGVDKKMVNTGAIKKWCKKKGISEKLAFVIARSVYDKGIERSMFFTKPLERRMRPTLVKYHKAIADDIAKNFADKIAKQLRTLKKKK